jgi:hypothetical protein
MSDGRIHRPGWVPDDPPKKPSETASEPRPAPAKPSPAQRRRKPNRRSAAAPAAAPPTLVAAPSTRVKAAPPKDHGSRSGAASDIEAIEIARRYRKESLATLISVCRDPKAPASARAMAARTLLERSDGKPSQTKPLTVADLATMPEELQFELLSELLLHRKLAFPQWFEALIEKLARLRLEIYYPDLASRPDFQWGDRPDPPPRLGPPLPDRRRSKPRLRDPGRASNHVRDDRDPEPDPDPRPTPPPLPQPEPPHTPLPAEPNGDRPAPFGLRYGLDAPPAPSRITGGAATANGPDGHNGGIHPDVLFKSTLPPKLALDSVNGAFDGIDYPFDYSRGPRWR